MIGQTLTHYRITEQIGAGGMGVVYLAHDQRLERDVALKVLPPGSLDEAARKRFRQEALTLSKLNHPNIAIIFDFNTADQTDFLVTEFVSGITLDTKLLAGPLHQPEVIRLGIQLAEGLAAAHAQNIVHRDLKPANLRLTTEGRLKILDFGLAQLAHPDPDLALTISLNTTQQITGTLPYMAPEQLRGAPVDARSDIWAAGAVLYEMAAGKRPFPETTGPVLIDAILNRAPEPPIKLNPEISPGLENVILKTLEKDPARRYQSSKELQRDLERLTSATAAAPARANQLLWLAACAAVLLVALAVGGFLLSRHKPQPQPQPVVSAISVRRSVAVLGFKNLSGRPDTEWLSTALSEMLTTELAAGEKLLTISGENVARAKSDLSLPEQDTLAPDTLAKVHKHLGSDFVVLGSYLDLGSDPKGPIRLDLRIQDTKAGETIAIVSEKGTLAELDSVITRAGLQLRQKLGAGEVPVEEQPAIRAALPSNLKASQLYSEGLAKLRRYDALGARDLLLKAVKEDSQHVPSLVALSSAWSTLGYDTQSLNAAKRAFDLSSGLPRVDRLRVEGQYYEQSSQWPKAIAAYKALFELEPDNLDFGLKLAGAQLSSGHTTDALGTLAHLRTLPAPHRDDLRIDLFDAKTAQVMGDFKRERALADSLVEKGQKQGARMFVIAGRLAQCTSTRQLGDPKTAIPFCQQAQELAAAAGDHFGEAMAMNAHANSLYDQGNVAEARRTYQAAVKVYREIGNMHGLAGALDNIASIIDDQGDHVAARRMSEEALATYKETGFQIGVGETLNNIGAELVAQGDLAGAQQRFAEALAIWRQLGNTSGAAISLTNLGDVLFQLGDIVGARSAYKEAFDLFQQNAEKTKTAYPQVGLGDALLAGGDITGAKKNYEEGLATARAGDDKHESAFALSGLADVAFEAGDLPGARKYVEAALAIRNELGEKEQASSTLIQLAVLSLEEDKFAEAESQARQALSNEKSDRSIGAALAHAMLSAALAKQNNLREAQHESALAKQSSASTQQRQVQLQIQLLLGEAEASSSNLNTAISSLTEVAHQAEKLNIVRTKMTAQLLLGQIELKAGKPEVGRSRLLALATEAQAKGFTRIAAAATKSRP